MKHQKPYVPMCRRTPQSPERWQTARWNGEQYERAPAADMQAAIYACQACPLLAACSLEEPVPESIHAGTIYDAKSKPYPSVAAFCNRNRKKLPGDVCGDRVGTHTGYHIHRKSKEQPCDPCRDARNAAKREADARRTKNECSAGHKRTPSNTRLNKANQRVCIDCRPELSHMDPWLPGGSELELKVAS